MLNPWKQAALAERRAEFAEERAGFLEKQLAWMQERVLESRDAESRALKIVGNFASQAAWGAVPYPEATRITERESHEAVSQVHDDILDSRRAREQAISEFKKTEMQRFADAVK